MNIVITGSHGFIGRHLSEALLSQKHMIHCIDRDKYFDKFSYNHADIIFHLASYGNYYHQQDEQEIWKSNIELSKFIFDTVASSQLVVYFSTSSVMLSVQTMYSTAKKICETYAFQKMKEGKHIIIVRPYSVFGEGEPGFRFIPVVIRSIITGEKFVLDPFPVHDWIYVRDFIRILLFCIEKKEAVGTVLSIGTGRQYTNQQVVNLLEDISSEKAHYDIEQKLRSYDTQQWVCDTNQLERFGVLPRMYTKFRIALEKTYDYYAARIR